MPGKTRFVVCRTVDNTGETLPKHYRAKKLWNLHRGCRRLRTPGHVGRYFSFSKLPNLSDIPGDEQS